MLPAFTWQACPTGAVAGEHREGGAVVWGKRHAQHNLETSLPWVLMGRVFSVLFEVSFVVFMGFSGLSIGSTSVFEFWVLNYLRFPIALLSHTQGAGIPGCSEAKARPRIGGALPDRTAFAS